jgi:hypothetical protein
VSKIVGSNLVPFKDRLELKVGDILAHKLYIYKVKITHIYNEISSFDNSFEVIVDAFFPQDNHGEYILIGEFRTRAIVLEKDWYIIERGKGR